MLVAHLSDLHLRDAGDVAWLERQLDRIAARAPDHLVITGDLLDRWIVPLLERVLDVLEARGLLQADRLTILHGNHDLASSGGHPRHGPDVFRLALRFWDPPPLVRWRRRRFYDAIARRAPGVAAPAPFLKETPGARFAVLDTVALLWNPVHVDGRSLEVQHGIGCIRRTEAKWLAGLEEVRLKADATPSPLIVLMHHYPIDNPGFEWVPEKGSRLPVASVRVPMRIRPKDQARFWDAAERAGTRLVLCGHVHRARLEHHGGIAVGLNGQSGAAWAGRTIAWYELDGDDVAMKLEREA